MVSSDAQKLLILVSPIYFSFSLVTWAFTIQDHKNLPLCFLPGVLQFQLFHWGLWSIMSGFLRMTWGRGPTSFSCIQLSACPSSICWAHQTVHWTVLAPLLKIDLSWTAGVFLGLLISPSASATPSWLLWLRNEFRNGEAGVLQCYFLF